MALILALGHVGAARVAGQTAGPDPLFPIIVDDKGGYINGLGEVRIDPCFDGVSEFSEGRAAVEVSTRSSHKEGFIDETGALAVEPKYDRVRGFSDGLAAVAIGTFGLHGSGDHRWGFVDLQGRVAVPVRYREVHDFSEGRALVQNEDGLWGYIDRTGNLVVPYRFEDAYSFSDGLAGVLIDGKWGYIDSSGRIVIDAQFSEARSFSEGLALVRVGGETVRPRQFYLGPPDGKYAFVDKTGKPTIELEGLEGAGAFEGGMASVCLRGIWGCIDGTGHFVIEPRFGSEPMFSDGLARVDLEDGVIAFVDRAGNSVLVPKFRRAGEFVNGLAEFVVGADRQTTFDSTLLGDRMRREAKPEMRKTKAMNAKQRKELLDVLKTRFEKNTNRHKGLEWASVRTRLEANTEKLWSLHEMESTGGEPDVVGHEERTGEYIFYDCSAESPKGRRSVCFDREGLESRKEHRPENSAVDMAAAMGVELLTEEQYRELQKLEELDTKTSSWIQTPPDIRALGGALYCDRRYGHVFVYHNGAPSYYAVRGFRGSLRV